MPKTFDSAPEKTSMVAPARAPHVVADPGSELKGKSNIPQIDAGPHDLPGVPSRPDVSKFSGTYTKIDDGLDYALAVVDDDPMGRTHKALNSLKYWEGTKDEFRGQFDVKDSDRRAPKDDDKR